MTAVLDLPEIRDRHAFNLERWREICADPEVGRLEGRVESDAHGHVLKSPPPGFNHSEKRAEILCLLLGVPGGRALPEVPVSTTAGIRGIDVVWISDQRRERSLRENVLLIAPEICVEVLSPRNTRAEMEEKRALLFEAGADEVWFCDTRGSMFFFLRDAPAEAADHSRFFPDFPGTIG